MVFSITALDLFVNALLYFPLKNSCSRGLVEVGDLEDMCCIDPVVGTTTHYMVSFNVELKDRYLDHRQFEFPAGRHRSDCCDVKY